MSVPHIIYKTFIQNQIPINVLISMVSDILLLKEGV